MISHAALRRSNDMKIGQMSSAPPPGYERLSVEQGNSGKDARTSAPALAGTARPSGMPPPLARRASAAALKPSPRSTLAAGVKRLPPTPSKAPLGSSTVAHEPLRPDPSASQSKPLPPDPSASQPKPLPPDPSASQSKSLPSDSPASRAKPSPSDPSPSRSKPLPSEPSASRSKPLRPDPSALQSRPLPADPSRKVAYTELGVPENAGWRRALGINESPASLKFKMNPATTPAEIEAMKAKLDNADTALKKAYKKLLIKYHPDHNLATNTKPVIDLLAESLQKGEKEIESARKKLDAQIEARDTQIKLDTQRKKPRSAWSPNNLFRSSRHRFGSFGR
jgi:hypothetical protein